MDKAYKYYNLIEKTNKQIFFLKLFSFGKKSKLDFFLIKYMI